MPAKAAARVASVARPGKAASASREAAVRAGSEPGLVVAEPGWRWPYSARRSSASSASRIWSTRASWRCNDRAARVARFLIPEGWQLPSASLIDRSQHPSISDSKPAAGRERARKGMWVLLFGGPEGPRSSTGTTLRFCLRWQVGESETLGTSLHAVARHTRASTAELGYGHSVYQSCTLECQS